MPSRASSPKSKPDKATSELSSDFIAIYDIRSGKERPCAICGRETAHLELELKSAFHNKKLSILIGPTCRLGLEAGLRAQRKWEIRGGKHAKVQ